MKRRLALCLMFLVSALAGPAIAPTVASAQFFPVADAAQACANETYASHDATLRRYGLRASHANWSYVGYDRRSNTRVWVYIRRGSVPIKYSIDGWCDISGYVSGNYYYVTKWWEVGISAPLG